MRLSEVAKYSGGLSASEQKEMVRRKKLNRHLSQVGGATGVAALALRSPQAARVSLSRVKALKGSAGMKHLVALEPKATKVSDAVGTTAIGSGAINSFNWARIQGLETKEDKARFRKRDDRFLRNNRNRISPKAEAGYSYLRRGRNSMYTSSAIDATLAGSSLASAAYLAKKRVPVLAGAAGAAGAAMGVQSARQFKGARAWEGHMKKIRARAKTRAGEGYYGVGRGLEPTDPSSKAKVDKALLRAVKKPVAFGVRRGGLVRTASGRQVTRRGAISGTGRLYR